MTRERGKEKGRRTRKKQKSQLTASPLAVENTPTPPSGSLHVPCPATHSQMDRASRSKPDKIWLIWESMSTMKTMDLKKVLILTSTIVS